MLAVESVWLWAGLTGYAASAAVAWHSMWSRHQRDGLILILLLTGVALLAVAITERWLRVGYGPFLTMFEILLSNLFSLGFILGLVFWRVPLARPALLVSLLVLLILGAWILFVPSGPSYLPATYENNWLWVHVAMGKVFLGTCLVAVGLAGVLLLRRFDAFSVLLSGLPDTPILDAVAWRFVAVAFVFESLMVIAGAVWAQDAWGRYWDWDPLETWSFVTWLMLGLSLHLRVTYTLPLWSGWLMILCVFSLAFLTFFGVPFISASPHKGAV